MNNTKRRINKMSRFIARHQDEIQSEYNLYCDKSCHLVSDPEPIMAIGAISCPKLLVPLVNRDIRQIKYRYRLLQPVKWTKMSLVLEALYQELLDYFFSKDFLRFQGLVISDKHKLYSDRWTFRTTLEYYAIYSELCTLLMAKEPSYNLYFSTTDARSRWGSRNIRNRLNELYNPEHIKNIHPIRFMESELLQLTNLFVGALTYKHRQLKSSPIKLQFLEELCNRENKAQFNETFKVI